MLPIDRTLLFAVLLCLIPFAVQAQDITVPDDYGSIQTAINNANDGDLIEVKAGMYGEDVTVDKELTLEGPNVGTAGDDNRSSGEATIKGQVVISASDVVFDGFDVAPPPATSNAKGEALRIGSGSNGPDNVIVKNNIVRDFEEDNLGEGLDGIIAFGGSGSDPLINPTIADNLVKNLDRPVSAGGAAGISIQGNVDGATVEGNTVQNIKDTKLEFAFGIVVRESGNTSEKPGNVTITNNDVSNITDTSPFAGVGLGVEERDENEFIDITGNKFRNIDFQIEDKTQTLDRSDLIQNNNFDPIVEASSITVNRRIIFGKIQAAVDLAVPGATVTAPAGMYAEDVTVDKELTLKGPNSGTPGDENRGNEATIEGQVIISASGAVFDGFNVTPGSVSSNSTGEALRIGGTPNNVTVKNNIVRDANGDNLPTWEGLDGIVAFGGEAGTPIDGVTISKNLVKNLDGRDTKGGAAGISIQGNVQNATVTDNRVTSIGQQSTAWAFGITVRGTENHEETPSDVNVKDNDVSSVLSNPSTSTVGVGFGFEGGDVNSVTVENNSFSNTALQVEDKTLDVGPGLNLDNIINQNNNTFDRAVTIRNSNGNVKDEGGVQRIYSPISPAVENADPGETVQVNDGNYDEVVTVGKRLTVQNASTPTVNAFDVAADNVTIDGFKITGGTVGGETAGIVVQSSTSGHTFSANTLNGPGDGTGLRVRSGARDTEITENNISDWTLGVDASAPGQNVQVTGNCITGNATAGVQSSGGQILTAAGNYWGAASGPSGDYPGTGDAAVGPVTVDFSPEPVAACPSGDPTPACTATTLSESVTPPEDGDPGVVTATFTNTDGLEEIEYTKLDNFTVTSEPSGFTRSGDTWTADDLQNPPTTAVFDLTQTTVGDPSTYFAIAASTCPTEEDDRLEVNFDPVHELPPEAPATLQFAGNAPNPFGDRTTIEFALPEPTDVTLTVYDMMGRRVATLVDGPARAGTHQIPWAGGTRDGQALASGVYLLRLTAGDQAFTERMTLVR